MSGRGRPFAVAGARSGTSGSDAAAREDAEVESNGSRNAREDILNSGDRTGRFEAGQLARDGLEANRWYVGRGQDANVGLWDGEHFLIIARQRVKSPTSPPVWQSVWGVREEAYFTGVTGGFQPFAVIDEGEVSQPPEDFGDAVRGYAGRLRFGW